MRCELIMHQQPPCDCCGADDFHYGFFDSPEAAKAKAEHKEQGPLTWRELGAGNYHFWHAQSPTRWWTTYSIEAVEAE